MHMHTVAHMVVSGVFKTRRYWLLVAGIIGLFHFIIVAEPLTFTLQGSGKWRRSHDVTGQDLRSIRISCFRRFVPIIRIGFTRRASAGITLDWAGSVGVVCLQHVEEVEEFVNELKVRVLVVYLFLAFDVLADVFISCGDGLEPLFIG